LGLTHPLTPGKDYPARGGDWDATTEWWAMGKTNKGEAMSFLLHPWRQSIQQPYTPFCGAWAFRVAVRHCCHVVTSTVLNEKTGKSAGTGDDGVTERIH